MFWIKPSPRSIEITHLLLQITSLIKFILKISLTEQFKKTDFNFFFSRLINRYKTFKHLVLIIKMKAIEAIDISSNHSLYVHKIKPSITQNRKRKKPTTTQVQNWRRKKRQKLWKWEIWAKKGRKSKEINRKEREEPGCSWPSCWTQVDFLHQKQTRHF